MLTREKMHNLSQEIIDSYEARAAGITSLRKEVTAQRQATQAELRELDKAHQAMAWQQRADLAKGRSDLTQAEAQRKSEVNAWMKDVATAHAEAQDEWQKLTATMESKRGGVAVAVKPLIEEIAEEAAEITPETAVLRDRVFEYLANHPDGTRLVELAEEFGVARVQIGKVIRNLMDENKVEKRDLLYFAV